MADDPSHRQVIWPAFEITEGWAYPILNAINERRFPKEKWSESKLAFLALSIETRVGTLFNAEKAIRGLRTTLQEALDAEKDIRKFVDAYAFPFHKHRSTLRDLQVSVHAYTVEARACFYNLADFYLRFASNYLSLQVSKQESLDHVAKLVPGDWAQTLKTIRDRITHGDTPYLEFELVSEAPRGYELLVDFNGTFRRISRDDPNVVTFSALQNVVVGLGKAREALQIELVGQAKSHAP